MAMRPRAEREEGNWRRRNDADSQKRRGQRNDAGGDEDRQANTTRRLFHKRWVKIAIAIGVLIIVGAGVIWWLSARHYESTDDAFIDTHIVRLSPQIAGQVMQVLVKDNQLVHRGDLLVRLNPADEQARLDQIVAQKAQAQTALAEARAAERGIAAQAGNANREVARYRALMKAAPAAVARQQMDQAIAKARNVNAQRAQSQAQIKGAQAQIHSLDAQIEAAKLNLGYTRITAPETGHVAQKNVAVGTYVTPGQQLLAIVPLALWVTANFKETQLGPMRVGQHVDVTIDACGLTLSGHVDSIQRGAGQAFGILPPENATGNYVKVVQRVPVKIVLDRMPDPRRCVLGPGMSVEPKVTVR